MNKTAAVLMAALLGTVLMTAGLGCKLSSSGTAEPPPVLPNDVVFVFGQWVSPGYNADVQLKKFDNAGTEDTASWDKLIDDGATESSVEGRLMAMDSSGSIYIAYSSNAGASKYDWRIKKFDAAGNEDTTNWDKTVDGGMTNGNDNPTALVVDGSDQVYVIGYFTDGVDTAQFNWCIKKYDAGGTEITTGWPKILDSGASSSDVPRAAAVDSDNNLYVTGTFPNAVNNVIKKYSPGGVEDTANWNKLIAGQNLFSCMAVDGADNVYVGGGLFDVGWIKKYSSAGVEDTTDWNKTINLGAGYETILALAVDSSDNLYAALTWQNNWHIKKFSSLGTEITEGWDKVIDSGGNDYLASLAVGELDDLYAFGTFHNGVSAYDWVIKKFSPGGTEDTVNWDKVIAASATNAQAGQTILVDW